MAIPPLPIPLTASHPPPCPPTNAACSPALPPRTPSNPTPVDPSEAGAKYIVTSSRDATVKFWDLETGFCDHTISDHGDWVPCIAVRPASTSSASMTSSGGKVNNANTASKLTITTNLK